MKNLSPKTPFLSLSILAIIVVIAGSNFAESSEIHLSQLPADIKTPFLIDINKKAGPSHIEWTQKLNPGFYELELITDVGSWRRDFIIRVNNREIAYNSAYFHSEKKQAPSYKFGFVITRRGKQFFEMTTETGMYPPERQQPIKVLQINIANDKHLDPVSQMFEYNDYNYALLWGWHAVSDFQRREKMNIDYWKKRIVDESAGWGANYIQIFPEARDDFFSEGNISQAAVYAHQKGFIIDQHCHSPAFALHNGTLEQRMEVLESHMSKYSDIIEKPFEECLDGWETEKYGQPASGRLGSKENVIRSSQITWKYHPGCVIGDCKQAAGTLNRYWQILHEGYHGPNYGKVLMCCGSYMRNGYDDMDTMSLFPDDLGFINDYNIVFRTCQANSRIYSPNICGGRNSIDWIAKQCSDFFRVSAYGIRNSRMPISTALNWLGDTNLTVPEDLRHAIYALSMDPCKGSMVYSLATVGYDGQLNKRIYNRTLPGGIEQSYRPRAFYPKTTQRIHNGFLALNCSALGDIHSLDWDPEGLGQFDVNSKSLELCENLIETSFSDNSSIYPVESKSLSADKIIKLPEKLKDGCYNLEFNFRRKWPAYYSVNCGNQYIGGGLISAGSSSKKVPFYVAEPKSSDIKIQGLQEGLHGGPNLYKSKIYKTNLKCAISDQIGVVDSSSGEFTNKIDQSERESAVVFEFGETPDKMYSGLSSKESSLPERIGLMLDKKRGSYILCIRARASVPDSTTVDIALNPHRSCYPLEKWIKSDCRNERIDSFTADNQWRTFQIPLMLEHRAGIQKHLIAISLDPEQDGTVEFDSIYLLETPITYDYKLRGGHISCLVQNIKHSGLQETRQYKMVADEPALSVVFDRKNNGNLKNVTTTLARGNWSRIEFDNIRVAQRGETDKIPYMVKLFPRTSVLPKLTIFILNSGKTDTLKWTENGIELIGKIKDTEKLEIVFSIRKDEPNLSLEAFNLLEIEDFDNDVIYTNNSDSPVVKLVKILPPIQGHGPYFVKEGKWWKVRGAQQVIADAQKEDYYRSYERWINYSLGDMPTPVYSEDYVRVILGPKESGQVQPAGYINNIVKPGRGSQKQLLLSDISENKCTVRVLAITPYVYAPRIEFAEPFTHATLDGKPWNYHDGRYVHLPQAKGDYRIEVKNAGNEEPCVLASSAFIKKALYEKQKLIIEIDRPEYVFKLPDNLNYHAALKFDPDKYRIENVKGGKVLRTASRGAILKFEEKQIEVSFAQ